jgi:hypothetical protein
MQIRKKLCWLTIILFWLAGCSQVQENVREEVTDGTKTSAAEEVKTEIVARDQEEKAKATSPASPAVKGDKPKEASSPVVAKPAVGKIVVAEKPKAIITTPAVKTIPETVTKTESPKPAVPAPVTVGSSEKPVVKAPSVVMNTSPGNDSKEKIGDKITLPTVVKAPSIEEILKRAGDYYDKKDFVNAVVWYQRAADQRVSKAQYRLGEMYYNGEGVSRNFVQAEKWYRQAAEQGDALAQYRLGKLYYAVEDYFQAIQWFIKSARQELAESQKMLGRMYYQGQGTSQQLQEAFSWSLKAAEQGLADAQSNVALMYFKGEGVERDYIRSYQWVSLAAAQGNQEAIKARDVFIAKISPAQLSEGERLARDWAAKHPAKK